MENKHWCYMCRTEKLEAEFNNDSSRSNGKSGRCKKCQRIIEKKYHKNRDPIKLSARYKVNLAIKNGDMERLPCEVCGENKTEAHHDDYSKPLEVRWLCVKHHKEHHKDDLKKEPRKYKKNPTRLFQIRLSEREYLDAIDYFKDLDVTRRSWFISRLKGK